MSAQSKKSKSTAVLPARYGKIAIPLSDINSSPFLLSAEVRSILRCSKRTLIRLYKGYRDVDGKFRRPVLGSIKRGNTVLFETSEVNRFLAARTRMAA